MNKNQLICMWLGIVAILCFTLPPAWEGLWGMYYNYKAIVLLIFCTAIVTGGLIVTFKDKKTNTKDGSAKENDSKPKTD